MTNITLQEIKTYAKSVTDRGAEPLHTREHLERVVVNAVRIVHILGMEKDVDLNMVQAICYLHDVPVNLVQMAFLKLLRTFMFERNMIKKYLPAILDRFHLSEEEEDIMYDAIAQHPYSIPFRKLIVNDNVYAKILQDADSFDYISVQREQTIRRQKNESVVYTFINLIYARYIAWIKHHFSLFLNYPELAQQFLRT